MRFIHRTSGGRRSTAGTRPHPITRSIRHLAILLAAGAVTTVAASAQFTGITAGLTNATNGAVAWGDYDSDGQLDLALTGNDGSAPILEIYHNNGSGFNPPSTLTPGLDNGSRVSWADYDGDGDLDLLALGADAGGNFTTTLYQNSGGSFTPAVLATPFTGLGNGSISWGDYDNDGDLDLFLSGTAVNTTTPKAFSAIYRNDGSSGGGWVFTRVLINGLPQLGWGCGAWGDYDSDGDLDIVYSGYDGSAGATAQTVLYKNNLGVFQPVATTLMGAHHGSLAWGDYDNDGDVDLVISGIDPGGSTRIRLYRNTSGSLVPVGPTVTLPTAVAYGSLGWGDHDNNGTLDLLVVGLTTSTSIAQVWNGPGTSTGSFSLASGVTGVKDAQGAFGDYDNDGRLDIALTGFDPAATAPLSEVYRYTGSASSNTAPNAPSSLSLSTTAKSFTLSWSGASDAQTPTANLHYNLSVVDVTAGSVIVAPPMANTGSGFRQIPALGNAGHLTSRTITHLTPGHTYDICVQTIDGAWTGSAFACTTSVTLPSLTYDMLIRDCSGDVGSEPNSSACGSGSSAVMWASPDIWCNPSSSGTTHIDPPCSTATYVHVQVKNIGSGTHPGGTVQVFFAKASTGLIWQQSWVNNSAVLQYGELIGQTTVGSLGSGSTTTVAIPWGNVPDPSDFGGGPGDDHFCLLARFIAADDPITTPETFDIFQNTMNNNNIAWRNIVTIDADGPAMAPPIIEVNNPFEAAQAMDLSFFVAGGDNSFLDHGTITVDLGSLFQVWQNSGSEGIGMQVASNDPSNTSIVITSNNATLRNITFPANSSYGVKFNLSADYNAELAGQAFDWHVAQSIHDATDPFGGETFTYIMPSRQSGKRAIGVGPDAENVPFSLAARPNPTSGSAVIGYTLPAPASVKLAIYDTKGTLVRTLIGAADQKQGAHEAEWNGLDQSGEQVSAGTYFYRLDVGGKLVEGQIKIVR